MTGEALVGNEEVSEMSAVAVYAQQGQVVVACDHPSGVCIVDPYGRSWVADRLVAGRAAFALPAGLYFVKVNNQVYRVLNH